MPSYLRRWLKFHANWLHRKILIKNQNNLCNLLNNLMEMKKVEYNIKEVAQKAASILLEFDRLPNNSDKALIKERLETQLQIDGCVTLAVFGCLDWIKSRLFTSIPEDFISDVVREYDLFMPRVPKINEIIKKMQTNGITTKVLIILGDTDVDEYFEKILNTANIFLDRQKLGTRIEKYKLSFTNRTTSVIYGDTEVIYWSGVKSLFTDDSSINIPEQIFREATNSMVNTSTGESYKKLGLNNDNPIFQNATNSRIKMYSSQGEMVDKMLNGIVLQTETPWMLTSSMLKLNSPSLPIIYPWIRKEELGTI